MVLPIDLRKMVGTTVSSKASHVMSEAECNRLYGSQKKVNMVEGVVINVDLKITKQRQKQFYVIADYKKPDGSVKRARLHIRSVVAGPVLVPVPFNIPATAHILTATTTTIALENTSISVPADHCTTVEPAPVTTTTTTTVATTFLQQPLLSLPIVLLFLPLNLNQ